MQDSNQEVTKVAILGKFANCINSLILHIENNVETHPAGAGVLQFYVILAPQN